MSATTVNAEVTSRFTPGMELLRREFHDAEWPNGTSEDQFDACSEHVTLSVNGALAGMVRLTRRPPSVLSTWAVGRHHIPTGDDIVEATRAVVAKQWRGHGFYKILMVEATIYCDTQRFTRVIGVIELDFPLRGFLARLGYRDVGEPTVLINPPKGPTTGQIILQEPSLTLSEALRVREESIARLTAQGVGFRTSISRPEARVIALESLTRPAPGREDGTVSRG